jgi:hypothetical protein
VVLSNEIYLTAEHVGKHFVLSHNRHARPPKVNNLENKNPRHSHTCQRIAKNARIHVEAWHQDTLRQCQIVGGHCCMCMLVI